MYNWFELITSLINMRYLTFIFLILIVSIGALAQNSVRVGNAAPQFAAAATDGVYYDLAAMRGRVVVLTFWSTKCEICRSEIPKLNGFISKFDENAVVFLAPTLETDEKLEGFLRANPFKAHILPNSFGILLQYADRDREGNLDMGFPAYFVIDQKGNLAYRASGWDRTNELYSKITRLVTVD